MNAHVYVVRHGEVEHHQSDIGLTARGQAQAESAGQIIAAELADGQTVAFQHSPVIRVVETAVRLRASLQAALAAAGRAERLTLLPAEEDEAWCNVRFILQSGQAPQEPSLLYAALTSAEYQRSAPPDWVRFYRGFWGGADPMGYWLSQPSGGAAETPAVVWARLRTRLRQWFAPEAAPRTWIGVSHSGALRLLLRQAFGADPGEPEFCAILRFQAGRQAGQVELNYLGKTTTLSLDD